MKQSYSPPDEKYILLLETREMYPRTVGRYIMHIIFHVNMYSSN